MGQGKSSYIAAHPEHESKIDNDKNISASIKRAFWKKVDEWDGKGEIDAHVTDCCNLFTFKGAAVVLSKGEQLGTAQTIDRISRDLSSQYDATQSVPTSAKRAINREIINISGMQNTSEALNELKKKYGNYRLRYSLRYGSSTRIFAFQGKRKDSIPLKLSDLAVQFASLAIPNADPKEYVMLAFEPKPSDELKKPTALDANVKNLDEFVAGGKTAGGVDEVICEPPLISQITYPPRKVV